MKELEDLKQRVSRNEEVLGTLISWLSHELGESGAIQLIEKLGFAEIRETEQP